MSQSSGTSLDWEWCSAYTTQHTYIRTYHYRYIHPHTAMLRKCSYTSQTSTTKVLGRLTKTQWFEGILTRNTPYWARFAHLHNAIHNSLLITELHTWQVLQIYSHFYICTDYIALQTCVRTYVRTAMPCPVAEKFADPSLLAIFGTYSGWDLYTFPSVWSVSDTYMYVNGSSHYWV